MSEREERLQAAVDAVLELAKDDTCGWSYRDAINAALKGVGDE